MKNVAVSILFFFLLVVSPLRAAIPTQYEGDSWTNTQYNTTEGTEFWVTFMRNSGGDESDATSMTLYLYATSREDAIVLVENPNTNYRASFNIQAGKQSFFKVPNDQAYIQLPRKISNLGLKVTSSKPISLYSTSHHRSGKYDATNILPAKSLLGEYTLQTYLADQYATELAIVATTNQAISISTKETIINKDEFDNNGVAVVDSIIYQDTIVNLNKGQSFLIRSLFITGDLSGTRLCSNAPFALYQGGQSAKITQDPENHIFHQSYSS